MERHVRRTSGTTLPRHTTSNQSNNNNNNRVASPYNTPDINQSRATISYGGGSPPMSSNALTSPVRRASASSPTPHQTPHANAAKQKLQLPRSLSKQFSSDLDPYILRGLTLAGVIVYCLNTLFQLFHVDVFLTAYKLPSTTYSFGRLLFSFLSTTGSLYGAWWLDDVVAATRVRRSDVVGCLGLAVAVTFILPFCRFWTWHDTEWAWHILDGVHFVISMSLYDTLATILSISLASAVSDDHNMTDAERVANMSSSQAYSLVASLVVATIGLQVFDAHRLQHFQFYVVVIAILSVASFGMAQSIITGKYLEMQGRHDKSHHRLFHVWKGWTVAVPRDLLTAQRNLVDTMNGNNPHQDDTTTTMQSTTTNRNGSMSPIRQRAGGGGPHRQTSNASSSSNHSSGHVTSSNNNLGSASKQRNSTQQQTNQKLAWRRALRDLWHHTNFIRWIFLEMLLELQTHFLQTFFKTFLDRLLTEIPHEVADWSLSLLRPMCQVVTILIYLPIKWYGYAKVYTTGLGLLWILASGMWLFVTPSSTVALFSFLSVYTIGLEGLRQAGFYLVMSDLVLELKQSYAQQGRWDEPSLAGLLLGATTMVCKPMQSVLPIVAATLLDKYSAPDAEDAEDTMELYHEAARTVLYYLLVIPPWVCSLLQLWVWRDYDLHPRRTKEIRVELQEYIFYRPSTERDDTLLPTTTSQQGDNSAATIMVRNKSHNEMVPLATGSYDSDHPAQRRRHYQNHSSSNISMDNSSGRLSAVI